MSYRCFAAGVDRRQYRVFSAQALEVRWVGAATVGVRDGVVDVAERRRPVATRRSAGEVDLVGIFSTADLGFGLFWREQATVSAGALLSQSSDGSTVRPIARTVLARWVCTACSAPGRSPSRSASAIPRCSCRIVVTRSGSRSDDSPIIRI